MKKIFLLLLIISFGVRGVTLDDLIEIGLKNSPYIKEKEYLLESSKEKHNLTKKSRFGKVYLRGSYDHYSKETNIGFIDPKKGLLGMTFAKDIYGFGIGYTVPLFTGFRTVKEIKISKLQTKVSEIDLKLTKGQLKYNITSLYLKILSLQRQKKAVDSHIESLKKLYSNVKFSVNLGKKLEADLLKIEYQLEDAKLQKFTLEKNIENLKQFLKDIIGKPDLTLDSLEDVDGISFSEPKGKPILIEKLDYEVMKMKKVVERDKSLYFPDVMFNIFYSKRYGEGDEFDFYQISVTLNYTIFDFGVRKSRLLSSKKNYLSVKERRKKELINIQNEIRKALNDIDIAEKKIETAEKQIKFSKEVEKIEKIRYESNVSDIYDYLKAKTQRLFAETKYYQAFYDAQIKKAYLRYIINGE